MTGAERIAAERRRQVEVEGWTPERDDAHARDELAIAAMAYASPRHLATVRPTSGYGSLGGLPAWPWAPHWDKRPQDGCTLPERMRALEKSGALIAAELDRLQRVSDRLDAQAVTRG